MGKFLIFLTEMPFIGGWVKLILFLAPPVYITIWIDDNMSIDGGVFMIILLFLATLWLLVLKGTLDIEVVIPIIGIPWIWITSLGFILTCCLGIFVLITGAE